MTNTKTYKLRACAIFLIALILLELSLGVFGISSYAEERVPTGVLTDLTSDETFDASAYPEYTYDQYKSLNEDTDKSNDIELVSVISMAEGENGEIFVYTYEPLNHVSDTTAAKISLYTGLKVVTPIKKDLELISSEGAFKKYKILDFGVLSTTHRIYNFVEIERPFSDFYDESKGDHTNTNYVTHPVGKTWDCYYYNDQLVYEAADLSYVVVKPTVTDFIYYKDGFTLGNLVGAKSGCQSHYIAFNIEEYVVNGKHYNLKVEEIYDASMEYYERGFETTTITQTDVFSWIASLFGAQTETVSTRYPNGEEYNRVPVELSSKDAPVVYEGRGLLGAEYTWNRIMTSEDFLKAVADNKGQWGSEELEAVKSAEYVFAFAETPVETLTTTNYDSNFNPISTTQSIKGIDVREVDILRLHFRTASGTYNLGVVGDTTTGDGKPGATAQKYEIDWDDLMDRLKVILMIVAAILLVTVLSAPLGIVFRIVYDVLKLILKLLIKAVTIPFKLLIRVIFRKRRR